MQKLLEEFHKGRLKKGLEREVEFGEAKSGTVTKQCYEVFFSSSNSMTPLYITSTHKGQSDGVDSVLIGVLPHTAE